VSSQSFELASRPDYQPAVDLSEGRIQRRLVVSAVIVDPSSYHRIKHPRQVIQCFIAAQMQLPAPHFLANRFRRFVADRRTEVDKELPPPILRPPRAKRVAQKIETGNGIVLTPIVILAVDNLGLLRMELQSTIREALLQRIFQMFGLLPCAAVTNTIIGVPLEGNARIVPLHPRIEGIVQEQVRQQRTDHAALRGTFIPPLKLPIAQLHRGRQPSLDIESYPLVLGMVTHRPHQEFMIDIIEETLDIQVNNPVVAPTALARLSNRLMG